MRDDPLELYSRRGLAWFGRYLERYFLRHFDNLRTARCGPPPALASRTILYANHPSWWDPITLLLFATHQWPQQRIFAPIDAAALERYSILKRFGLFPLERGVAGVRRFVRVANHVLAADDTALALTPQGRFTDPRERPIALEPGLAYLLHADASRCAIPVALEYVHWSERLPEALVCFGQPLRVDAGESTATLHARLETALQDTADDLATAAMRREAAEFDIVIAGRRRGTSKLYDAFERIRAARRGRAFDASHGALED